MFPSLTSQGIPLTDIDTSSWRSFPRYEKSFESTLGLNVDIYLSLQSLMLSGKANPKRLHCVIPFCNIFAEYLFILAVMGLGWGMQDL